MPTSCRTFSSRRSIGCTVVGVAVGDIRTLSRISDLRPVFLMPAHQERRGWLLTSERRLVLARQRLNDGVNRDLNLGVGQGTVGVLEGEAHGQAHVPIGDALALVAIKFPHAHENRWCARADSATNPSGRQALIHDHREVSHDGREPRQRSDGTRTGQRGAADHLEIEFTGEHGRIGRRHGGQAPNPARPLRADMCPRSFPLSITQGTESVISCAVKNS